MGMRIDEARYHEPVTGVDTLRRRRDGGPGDLPVGRRSCRRQP